MVYTRYLLIAAPVRARSPPFALQTAPTYSPAHLPCFVSVGLQTSLAMEDHRTGVRVTGRGEDHRTGVRVTERDEDHRTGVEGRRPAGLAGGKLLSPALTASKNLTLPCGWGRAPSPGGTVASCIFMARVTTAQRAGPPALHPEGSLGPSPGTPTLSQGPASVGGGEPAAHVLVRTLEPSPAGRRERPLRGAALEGREGALHMQEAQVLLPQPCSRQLSGLPATKRAMNPTGAPGLGPNPVLAEPASLQRPRSGGQPQDEHSPLHLPAKPLPPQLSSHCGGCQSKSPENWGGCQGPVPTLYQPEGL